MGQFSWYAQDTNEPIYNDNEKPGMQVVHMVDTRDGTDYVEDDYEGYGVFGGRDFYELLADMNASLVDTVLCEYNTGNVDLHKPYKKLTEDELTLKRNIGISLWFAYLEPDGITGKYATPLPAGVKIQSPVLVMEYDAWRRCAGDFPKSDPNQGWHCEDEDNDQL